MEATNQCPSSTGDGMEGLGSKGGGGYAGHGAVLCAFLRVRHWGGGSVCTILSSHFMTSGCVWVISLTSLFSFFLNIQSYPGFPISSFFFSFFFCSLSERIHGKKLYKAFSQ